MWRQRSHDPVNKDAHTHPFTGIVLGLDLGLGIRMQHPCCPVSACLVADSSTPTAASVSSWARSLGFRLDEFGEIYAGLIPGSRRSRQRWSSTQRHWKGRSAATMATWRESLKETPTEAESLGRDIHGYMIEDEHSERLLAWSGRYVVGGRRISEQLTEVLKHDLRNRVRRHAQGYVRGEEWSPLPPEADLGLDRRLKVEETEKDERPKPPRPRSRSHSLGRVMQELDDDAKGEGDPQEAEGMAETYEVARSSGQTPQDAVATIAVVYETDEDDVKQKLRQYVRGHGRKKDGRHTGLCLEILKHMLETRRGSEERAEEVRKQANPSEARAPTPETSVPAYPQHFAPPPGLGEDPLQEDQPSDHLRETVGVIHCWGAMGWSVSCLEDQKPHEGERSAEPSRICSERAPLEQERERRRTRK